MHMPRHITGLGFQKWRQAVSDQKDCQKGIQSWAVVHVCGRRGHNASSCESRGQKLLSLLRKIHPVAQVQDVWRMNSKTNSLLEVTGRSLKNRMVMWEGKIHRAPFQEKTPCKLHVIIKKALQIPGDFKLILENESVVSLRPKKGHFFSQRSQPLARFSPRRVVYDCNAGHLLEFHHCHHQLQQHHLPVHESIAE